MKKTGKWVQPTPEYTEAMRCEEIRDREDRLKRAEYGAECRTGEIKDLKAKLHHAEEHATKLTKEHKELTDKASALSSQNEILKTLHPETVQATIGRLRSELAERTAQLLKCEQESEQDEKEYVEQIDELNADRTRFQSQTEAANKSISSLQIQISALSRALQDKTSEVELLKKSANGEVESAQSSLVAKLRGLVAGKDEELRLCQEEVATLKSSQQTIVPPATPSVSNSQTIKDEVAREKAANAELRNELQQVQNQHKQDVIAANARIESLKAEETLVTAAAVRSSDEYQKLLSTAQAIQQERDQLQEKNTQLESSLATSISHERAQVAEQKHTQLQNAHDKVSSQLVESERRLSLKTDQLEEAKQTIATKEQQIADRDRSIESLSADVEKPIMNVSGFTREQDAQIEDLRRQVADRDIKVAAHSVELDRKNGAIKDLKFVIEKLHTEIDAKKAAIKNNDLEKERLQSQVHKAEEARDNTVADFAEENERLTDLRDEIERALKLHSITNLNDDIDKQINDALLKAKDAGFSWTCLEEKNLIDRGVGDCLIDQVKNVAERHKYHQDNGAKLYAMLEAVAKELRKKFGKKENTTDDTLLIRVQKLIKDSESSEQPEQSEQSDDMKE